MPSDDTSIKERLTSGARMGQDPIDRLWAVIYALITIVLLVGAATIYYAEVGNDYSADTRELDSQRGALLCQTVILDNDRVFGVPSYCGRAQVRVYLPPEVCETFLPSANDCGEAWVEL